jgi:hypothetical protein
MRRAVPILLSIFAAGCMTAKVHRLDQKIRAPRPLETIQVLDEAPDQPHTVIAHIDSKADAVFDSYDDLRARIIEEAAELGGHALILGPESTESQPIILATGMIMSERRTLEADVIVFN